MIIWNDVYQSHVECPEYIHGTRFILNGDLTDLSLGNNEFFTGRVLIDRGGLLGDWYEFIKIKRSEFFKDYFDIMNGIKIPSRCSFECELESVDSIIKKYRFSVKRIIETNKPLMFPFYVCKKDNIEDEMAMAEYCGHNFGRDKVDYCFLCGSTIRTVYEVD